jgi:exonuclease I
MAAITERIDETSRAHMRNFFQTLSEKDQRRYAAVEAQRLGHGGITYVAQLLECSTKTISRGIDELDQLQNDPAAGRVRRQGAGRKKVSRQVPK